MFHIIATKWFSLAKRTHRKGALCVNADGSVWFTVDYNDVFGVLRLPASNARQCSKANSHTHHFTPRAARAAESSEEK